MMESKLPICMSSELDLFTQSPLQLSIDSSSFIEIFPVTSLSDKSPLEFFIAGNGDQFLDLSHTILHLQIQILKNDDTDIADSDVVAPINYVLNTMFSELSMFLNDKQISSQNNYSYRAYLESLLFSSKLAQESMLTSSLFYKDTASKHNDVALASGNIGFTSRRNLFKASKLVDCAGAIHFDLGNQPKLLINGVDVRIKLERHKNDFCLMSAASSYKLSVKSASLFIRKVNVAPSVLLAQEKALEKGLIRMPIRRTEIKCFTLSSGLQSSTIGNAFIGQVPTKIIIGFVSNEAFNGKHNKNPFKFHHYDLNYLSVLEGSQMFPSKPFTLDFSNKIYARSYLSLFTDLNRYHNSQNINISYDEFPSGYTLHCVDLTPDMASSAPHASVSRNGNLAIDLKFNAALTETVSLIVFAEYRSEIQIDRARSIYTNF